MRAPSAARQLHARGADAAGGPVNQYCLTRLEPPAPQKPEVHRRAVKATAAPSVRERSAGTGNVRDASPTATSAHPLVAVRETTRSPGLKPDPGGAETSSPPTAPGGMNGRSGLI